MGEHDDIKFEDLSRDECLELLASQPLGRVAVADFNAAPLVVPVNFVLHGEGILFRTDYGSKFRLAVLAGHPVSFEIDGVDPGRRTGWSVLVQGDAVEAEPADDRDAPYAVPWAPGRKDHWVRIVPQAITGRRIRLSSLATDSRAYL